MNVQNAENQNNGSDNLETKASVSSLFFPEKFWNNNFIYNKYPNKNKEYYIFLGVLLTLITCFFVPLINSFINISDGWIQYNSELMRNGKIVYKDFFWFLPPAHLLIYHLLSSICNNNFLIPRILGLLIRLLTVYFSYAVLCKFFKPSIVLITLLSSVILSFSYLQDTFYHYSHDALLFQIIALFLFLKFLESTSKNNLYLFFCGVFTSLSFLTKQVMIIYLLIWPLILLISNYYRRKKQIVPLLALTWGIIFPVFITAFFLYYYNALTPALTQIFGSSEAKGSLVKILFGFIPSVFSKKHIYLFLFFVTATVIGLIYKNKIEQFVIFPINKNIQKKIVCFLLFVSIIFLAASIFLINTNKVAIIAFICTLIIFFYMLSMMYKNDNLSILYLTVICITGIICVWFMPFDVLLKIYPFIENKKGSIINIVLLILFFMSIGGFLIILSKKFLLNINFWIITVWGFSYMLTHAFSVPYIEIHSALFPVALVFCIILSLNFPFYFLIKSIFLSFCIFIYISVFISRVNIPFIWWSWHEPPAHKYERVYLENNLKGFKVSSRTNEIITKITSDINNNISKEGTLFTFPYCPLFYVLSGKISPTFSPVHFFDVCPDFVTKEDLNTLKKNPPDMIVYAILNQDMSVDKSKEDLAWKLNETLFRNDNRSAARDIKELIENWMSDGAYIVVDQIENLFVLKKNN